MAIAEAEPKKGEVAVTSNGANDGIKVLNAGKNLAKNKGYANSCSNTSQGTIKRSSLYDTIKGFRFEMPDGWNDEDIGLFVTCCLEKKEDFTKTDIDRTKIWSDIAESGAEKSKNPSLFTINSCLELAERIRYYVSKNFTNYFDNEPFMQFYSDVKILLPNFSHNFVTNKSSEYEDNIRKFKNKSMSEITSDLLENDADLGDIIHDLTVKNAFAIRNGDPNVWTELTNKFEEILGLNIDSKTILESEKNKIISDVDKMELNGANKKDAFIERARGYIEVFDYIIPIEVKVNDYLSPSVDSTVDSQNNEKYDSNEKTRRLSCSIMSSNVTSESKYLCNDIKKINKRGKPIKSNKIHNFSKIKTKPKVQDDISAEPSSTTSFDELPKKEKLNENETCIKDEKNQFNIRVDSDHESKYYNQSKSFDKSSDRLKKERRIPVRVMPCRAARTKVVSYSLNKFNSVIPSLTSRHQNADKHSKLLKSKNNIVEENPNKSPEFKGFDSDSEVKSEDLNKFKRLKSTVLTKAGITNPDTTTKDSDDSSDSNVPYIKRRNRKRKDNIEKKQDLPSKLEDFIAKARRIDADNKKKNPIVKLIDCKHMNYPRHGNMNIFGLSKQQDKPSSFGSSLCQERNKDVQLIEESAVLAKDVVDSEYNPSSDSAKLVSDEHLNKGQCSGLINESKNVADAVSLSPSIRNVYSNAESSLQLTKHHINPFYGTSNEVLGSSSSNSVSSGNRKLQENSVSPYSMSAGTSSSFFEANKPSTSSCGIRNSIINKRDLESTLSALKKYRNELFTKQDNRMCISSSNVVQSNFVPDIECSKPPHWFSDYVKECRQEEAWKMQQFIKMHQELATIEHSKVLILEKIFSSLVDDQ